MIWVLIVSNTLLFILTCVIIIKIFSKYYHPRKNSKYRYEDLQTMGVVTRVFPSDMNFLSLQFSASRHYFLTLLSSILCYNFKSDILSVVAIILNFVHCYLSLNRYLKRKDEFNSLIPAGKQFLKPVKNACLVTTIYSHLALIFIYIPIFAL